jgi:chromosome segregation protein
MSDSEALLDEVLSRLLEAIVAADGAQNSDELTNAAISLRDELTQYREVRAANELALSRECGELEEKLAATQKQLLSYQRISEQKQKNLQTDLSRLRNEKDRLQSDFQQRLCELDTGIDECRNQFAAQKAQLLADNQRMQSRIESLEKENAQLTEDYHIVELDIEEKIALRKSLQEKIDKLQNELNTEEQSHQSNVDFLEKNVEQLKEQLQQANDQIQTKQQQIDELNTQIDQLNVKLNAMAEARDEAERQTRKAEREIERLKKQLERTEADLVESQREKREVERASLRRR